MSAKGPVVVVVTLLSSVMVGPASRRVDGQSTDVCGGSPSPPTEISVEFTNATYPIAVGNPTGSFQTGQDADIMLSGIDFNNTGGPLLFNHPAGVDTDGTRLVLADMFNNRVLIWRTSPSHEVEPDVVLGQPDFTSNDPGTGRDRMNLPVQVSLGGGHLAVADSNNHRILIWNSVPTQTGTAADLVLDGGQVGKSHFLWPWGVWTDGRKLVVSGTGSGNVVIWNTFPTRDNAAADIVLTGGGKIGTPRMIISDGTSLIVGDHNAKVPDKLENGTFFWRRFPTVDDAPYDFFMEDPGRNPDAWFRGTFTPDGRLFVLGATLYIWNSFPTDDGDSPDLSITSYNFRTGDAGGVAVAAGRVYVSSGNSNKVVVYNSIPADASRPPDFAIGSPNICTNTLDSNYFIANPVAVSDGTSLFAASDHDLKLHVWRNIPDQSGAHPDFVYTLPFTPWGAAIYGRKLALAGAQSVYVWDELPQRGELPSRTFRERIGSVEFQNLRGVAIDDRYFYLADSTANKIYVWSGIPSANSEPAFTLAVSGPRRLSSDGTYLTVAQPFEAKILVYPVRGLTATTTPTAVGPPGLFNLPASAYASSGRLFVADQSNNRVEVWSDIQTALAGREPDLVLGEMNLTDTTPEIGRNKTFYPASVFHDGKYLWVGEFKFSGRLLRFSAHER